MVTVEKADPDDLPSILGIEKLSFSNPWTEEQFRGSFPHFSVAREDGKVVGFIGVELIQDEAHILHMAVHPDFRRAGVAKKMMEFALSRPAAKWFLEVRANNLPAQKLYESFGFGVISRRNKYYQDNDEDALVMEYQRPN
ncbi:MAG TPA: ribosomal protein S18-alanine N-acetyltransferase [Candidatus Omnitrophota bacterium]|nr:ribosomal protein S18-alanine N-acetyltransferase [Candidatus Omnitrophota bacterium]